MEKPLVTTSNQTETITGAGTGIATIGQGHTVLGNLQPQIPIGGRIRAGIMVLTKAVEGNHKAGEIYRMGVEAGTPYKKIAREIMDACKLQRSPLTPKNAPYFTVRECDFKVPGVATSIMQQYGEDRPDISGYQLYRFPVIFPLDSWQGNMPHEFACYSLSERKYWSQYDDAGHRFCMQHGEAEFVGKGRNRTARRMSGGRPTVLRASNSGICNPDECPEYQTRECTLSGRFIFYIPGVSGASAIDLPTRSFYAMQDARQQMEMVSYITGGRISGTHRGKALFWLSKKAETVSMIDPKTGKPKRVNQWIITLEADVDMSRVFAGQEADHALIAGGEAAAALGYDSGEDMDLDDSHDGVAHVIHEGVIEPEPEPEPPPEADQPSAGDATVETVQTEGSAAAIRQRMEHAADIDAINESLDLLRGNDAITEDDAKELRHYANERVKELRS